MNEIEQMYAALDVTVKGLIAICGDNTETLQRLDHALDAVRKSLNAEYDIPDYEAIEVAG